MRSQMGAEELVELGRGRSKSSKRRLLPRPKPGALGAWAKKKSASARHAALKKVVAKRGCQKVIGSLTLLRNLSVDSGTKKMAKSDAKWLHSQGFCRLKSK